MITLSSNAKDVQARLRNLAKQMPTAAAYLLNGAAFAGKDAIKDEMQRVFDRPTPYTLRALRVRPTAKPNSLMTRIEWKGSPDKHYLEYEVFGGRRKPKSFEKKLQQAGIMPRGYVATVGKGASLDRYGNLSRGQLAQILSVLGVATQSKAKTGSKAAAYFASTPASANKNKGASHLPHGVYKRVGVGIVTILRFVPAASYRKRLAFHAVAIRAAKLHMAQGFDKAIAFAKAKALKS